jgi:hypothetical protein
VNLKSISLAAAAMAALAGPACAGAAEDAFTSFHDFCGTLGEYQGALDKADAAGWKAAAFTSDTMAGVKITDKATRSKVAGAEAMALSVTRGAAGKPGDVINVNTCTVTSKADFSAVAKLAGSWLAIAPASSSSSAVTFHYTPNGAAVTAVAAGGQNAALAGGGYMILTVVDKGAGLAMIDLVALKR